MKQFNYTIQGESGIHARPAGLLVKECSKYKSEITIDLADKHVSAKKLFDVMGLGARQNDELLISIKGEDEQEATEALEKFFKDNV
jgi:phosphocarrier protein